MRPDLEHYYLIDQYLEHKLKGAELAAFENQLAQDNGFAQEVYEQRMLNDLILESELKGVRDQIEKDLSAIQNPSFFRMHWQWIGLGVLCFLGILYYAIPSKNVTEHVQDSSVAAMDEIKQSPDNNIEPAAKPHDQSAPVNILPKNTSTEQIVVRIPSDTIQSITSVETVKPIGTTPVNGNILTEVKPTEENKKIDCSATKITFSVSTEMSCADTHTGSIHIDKITGGNAPYIYTLNNKKIKDKNISELSAGTYEIKISDKNGCFSEYQATVMEKNCMPTIQQGTKFNINPTIGEVCSIPFNTDKKGTLTVYSRGGKIIYRAINPSGDYVEWTGTDGYGALAEAGLYVYIIEYTDGTKVTGEVNIVR